MAKFSANLSMLFTEVAFLDRFASAARAGFKGVEYVSPYEHAPEVVSERLRENGLTQALFNLPAGDWGAGERGLAIFPERQEEFRASVATAIRYAKALGCRQVNCLAGIAPSDVAPQVLHATFVDNLRFASSALKSAGILLLVEAINTRDMPGFFLNTSRQALSLIDEVGSDNLFFQYDVYHMQVMEGDLAETLRRNIGRIKHVQVADNPGRHEPGTGEINYPFIFRHLDAIGYDGWIGAEYKPATETARGLGWIDALTA
jgi:hydroxypyruvate isomerase